MHALEKILADHADLEQVKAGEIINCKIDVAGINDLYLQTVYSFKEIKGEKVANPDGTVIFFDHYAPASTIKQAENQKQFRQFCKEQNIENLMDINQGVCHQVLADKGFSAPGKVIVVTDSHTTTHGAFGAFSTGVGATDMATILKTGELWFRVPEIMQITINGKLNKGVYAKDLILHIIGECKADFAVYQGVEFRGTTIDEMSMSERMTLCNMTTEMGAKATYIQPDRITYDFLESSGAKGYSVYTTDEDYRYVRKKTYDAESIQMNVAVPFSVDAVELLVENIGIPVNQAFLGSCTGGKLEDLEVAAGILSGKTIHPDTRLLVVPASRQVLADAIEKGYITQLIDAGATLVTPGCAACLGTHQGMIASGDVCISSTNRNFPGRMGHRQGRIYLASPAVVAASALEGYIADPRNYL